jgi:hypothetical protein
MMPKDLDPSVRRVAADQRRRPGVAALLFVAGPKLSPFVGD